jgi:hypothetical protein
MSGRLCVKRDAAKEEEPEQPSLFLDVRGCE